MRDARRQIGFERRMERHFRIALDHFSRDEMAGLDAVRIFAGACTLKDLPPATGPRRLGHHPDLMKVPG
jgi:hypothetical protein